MSAEKCGHGASASRAKRAGLAIMAAVGRCGTAGGARERFGIRRGLFGVEREPMATLRATDKARADGVELLYWPESRGLDADGAECWDLDDGVGDTVVDVEAFAKPNRCW